MTDRLRFAVREGLTLVEMVVAMLVVSVGLLAMAGASGLMAIQIRVADLRTERMAAIQQAVEEVRAKPFTEIEELEKDEAIKVGDFTIWWDVESVGPNLVHLHVHSSGPGFELGSGWTDSAEETLTVSIARISN